MESAWETDALVIDMLELNDYNVIQRFLQAKRSNNSGYAEDCVKYAKENLNDQIWFDYNDKIVKCPSIYVDSSQLRAVFEGYNWYENHMTFGFIELSLILEFFNKQSWCAKWRIG